MPVVLFFAWHVTLRGGLEGRGPQRHVDVGDEDAEGDPLDEAVHVQDVLEHEPVPPGGNNVHLGAIAADVRPKGLIRGEQDGEERKQRKQGKERKKVRDILNWRRIFPLHGICQMGIII
jgi:hypothetical protein